MSTFIMSQLKKQLCYYYYCYLYPVLPFWVSGIIPLIHVQTLPILSCFALYYLPRSM